MPLAVNIEDTLEESVLENITDSNVKNENNENNHQWKRMKKNEKNHKEIEFFLTVSS